jgi:hypothetical protein
MEATVESDLKGLAAHAAIAEPAPTGDGRSVTDALMTYIDTTDRTEQHRHRLQSMLSARRELGRSQYGTELRTDNGRAAYVDCLQELLDAALYATQGRMEGRSPPVDCIDAALLVLEVLTDRGGALPR